MNFPEFEIQPSYGRFLLARKVIVDPQNPKFGPIAGYNVVGVFDTEDEAIAEQDRLLVAQGAP